MIVVTPGEKALIKAFEDAGIQFQTENLLVGDIHIKKNDQVLYIFERKAKGDLDASIKDGRYREQKSRLIDTGIPRSRIIYIIEQLAKPRDAPSKKRIWSAICNTIHRDGFGVFQTTDVDQTVCFINGLALSAEQFEPIIDSNISTDVNVNIKKRQVTPDDWFKYSLTLIPKCSMEIAELIVQETPNITAVIDLINDAGINCFAELRHGETKRRVGKKLSNEICEILLNAYTRR